MRPHSTFVRFYSTLPLFFFLIAVYTPVVAQPPRAHHLYISGTTAGANPATFTAMKIGFTLRVHYQYADAQGAAQPESGTTFQWYTYDSEFGTNKQPIAGATSSTLSLNTPVYVGKHISVEVTPRNTAGEVGTTVEFRPWNATSPNPVLAFAAPNCAKAGGGVVGPGNTLDTSNPLCSPRATTWQVFYTGIDYNNSAFPRIYIDWADGLNTVYIPTLQNPLTTQADTFALVNMANQRWQVTIPHTYSYTTTGGTSAASTTTNQRCTYTLRATWGTTAGTCVSGGVQTQPFTVWDKENNTSLGTHDINKDPTSAGVETGEITDICERDQSAIRLQDGSDFNCTAAGGIVESVRQNDEGRWIQFVYGTTSNVTTGPGATEKIIINGVSYTSADLPVYGRVTYQASATAPLPAITDNIQMPTSGLSGQTFIVTMRTWNTCNKLDRIVADGGFNPIQANPFNVFDITRTTAGSGTDQPGLAPQFSAAAGTAIYANASPVTRTYTIRIITKPPTPSSNDKEFCSGTSLNPAASTCAAITGAAQANSFELTAASVTGSTVINWYFGDPRSGGVLLTNSFGTNCRFFRTGALATTGAQGTMRTRLIAGTPGVYSLWATYATANGCISDPVEVKLTIRPTLTAPAAPAGPVDVCNNSAAIAFAQGAAAATTTIAANTITNSAAVNFNTRYVWSTSNADVTLSALNGTSVDASFNIATQPNPTATRTINTAREYTTATASGSFCTTGSTTLTVTVYGTTVGGAASGGSTICDDGTSTGALTVSGHRGSVLRWEREFGGTNVFVPIAGTAGLATFPGEVPGSGPGTYRYRAVIRNGPTGQPYNCSEVNSTSTTVVVNPALSKPTISASGVLTFCANSSVTLTSSNSGGNANSYQWYKGGVAIPGATSSTLLVNSSAATGTGSYTVQTIGVAPSNCLSPMSDPTVVTVHPLPTASNPSGGGSVCSGTPAPDITWSLTGTAPFNFTIARSVEGPLVVTNHNSTTYTITAPNPPASQTYQITSLSDANGCNATSMGGTASVTVSLTPPPTVDSFTGTSAVCDDGGTTNPPDAILDLQPNSVQSYSVAYRLRRVSTGVAGPVVGPTTVSSDVSGVINISPSYANFSWDGAPTDPQGYQIVIVTLVNTTTGCAGPVPISGPTLIINPRPATPTGAVQGVACSTSASGALISVDAPAAGFTIVWSSTPAPTFTAALGTTSGTRGNTFTPTSTATQTYYAFTRSDVNPTNCLSSGSLAVQHIQDQVPTASNAGTVTANCNGNFTLSANAPGLNELGTWTVPGILYQQSFAAYTNGVTTSSALNGWTRTTTGAFAGGLGSFGVQGNGFEANNLDGSGTGGVEVVWATPVISTVFTNASISVELTSTATLEASDYIRVFYRLNGGAETPLTNGNQSGNIGGTVTATAAGLTGTSLQLIIRVNNNAADETYRFDNISITTPSAPTISNPNDRNATVSNFPVGSQTFTWTITSQYGVCAPSASTVTLTRNPLPVVVNPTPALCEDIVGSGFVNNVNLNDYSDAITSIAGAGGYAQVSPGVIESISEDRRITWFTLPGPSAQMTDATDVDGVTNNKKYYFTVRTLSTGCESSGEITFTINAKPTANNKSYTFCPDMPPGNGASSTTANINLTTAIPVGDIIGSDPAAQRQVTYHGTALDANSGANAITSIALTATTPIFARVVNTVSNCVSTSTITLVYQSRAANNTIRDASNNVLVAGAPPFENTISICASSSLVLYQIDPLVNPGATYSWNIPAPSYPGEFEVLSSTNNYFVILKFPNATSLPASNFPNGIPITVTETLGTSCSGNPLTLKVKVDASPAQPLISGPNEVCENSLATYTITSGAGVTNTWSIPPGATITNSPTGSSINVQMGTFDGAVTVTASSGTGCVSPPSVPINVDVIPRPSVTLSSSPMCSGDNTSSYITLTPSATPPLNAADVRYNWSVLNVSGSLTGVAVGDNASGASNISQTISNTSGVPATVLYQVIPIGPSTTFCAGTTKTISLTVNPEPVLNLASKIICSGESAAYEIKLTPSNLPSGTTFSWGAPVMSDGSVQGNAGSSPMGPAGTVHINDAFVNLTGSPITATYTISAVSGTCVGNQPAASRQVVFTINPAPVGADVSRAAQCSNVAFSVSPENITNGLAGSSTFTWVRDALPTNLTVVTAGSGTGMIAETLRNLSGGQLTATYIVTPKAGNCTGATYKVYVPIDPEPVMTSAGAQTICSDETPTLVFASNVAGSTFTWEVINKTGTVTGADVGDTGTGNLNQSLNNISGSNATVTYRVTPRGPVAGLCFGNPQDVVITVRPEPVMTSAAMETICSNQVPTTVFASNVAGSTFSWEVIGISGSVTGAALGNTGTGNLNQTLVNVSGAIATVTYRVTPRGPAPGLCFGNFQDVVITVTPQPVMTSLPSETICSGSIPSLAFTANVAGSTFAWEVVAKTGVVSGAVVGNTGTGNLSQTLVNTSGASATVTYRVTPRGPAPGTCVGQFQDVVITVTPQPVMTSANNQSICSDDTPTLVFTSNVAGSTFAWEVIAKTGGVSGANIGDLGTGNLNQNLVNVSGAPATVTYRVTPTGPGALFCVGNPQDVVITITPGPVMTSPAVETICSDGTPSIVFTSNVIGSTFSWEVTNITGTVTGANVGDVGAGNLNQALNNISGAAATVTYRVTPRGPAPALCFGDFQDVVITVTPEPVITSPASETICSGDAPTIVFAANVGGTTFTWEVIAKSGTVSGATVGNTGTGNLNQILTNTSGALATVTYRITPRGPAPGTCTGETQNVVITVNPEPVITSANAQTICSDNAPTLIFASNVGGSTFAWEVIAKSGSVTGADIGDLGTGNLNQTLVNVSGVSGTVTYRVTPTGPAALFCTGNPQDVVITVTPQPVMTSAAAETICSDGTPSIVFTSNVVGVTFAWEVTNITGTVTGATIGNTGSGNLNQSLNNISGSAATVTYRVTPRGPAPLLCFGDFQNVVITVNPEPTAPALSTYEICSGDAFNLDLNTLITNAPPVGSRFSYSVQSLSSEVVAAPNRTVASADPIADIYTHLAVASTAPAEVIYTITPISNAPANCAGEVFVVKVFVNPQPRGTNAMVNTCGLGSQAFTYDLDTRIANGVTSKYTYEVDNDPVNPLPSIEPNRTVASNADINFNYNNTTGADATITYRVTPYSLQISPVTGLPTECPGAVFFVQVTLSPQPVGVDLTLDPICSNVPFTLDPQDNVGPPIPPGANGVTITSYTWTALTYDGMTVNGSVPPASGAGINPGDAINGVLTNKTSTQRTAVFEITPMSGTCPGPKFKIFQPVDPQPVIDPSITPRTICSDVATNITFGPVAGTIAAADYNVSLLSFDGPDLVPAAGNAPYTTAGTTVNNTTATAINAHHFTNKLRTNGLFVEYRVTPNAAATSVAGVCQGDALVVRIEVLPEPVMDPALANVSVCSDTKSGIELASDGVSVNASSFFINSVSLNGTSISGPNVPVGDVTSGPNNKFANPAIPRTDKKFISEDQFTLKVDGLAAVNRTVVYNVTPRSAANTADPAGCAGDPFDINLLIRPEPVLQSGVTPAPDICSGDPINITLDKQTSSVAIAQFKFVNVDVDPAMVRGNSNRNVGDIMPGPTALIQDTYTNITNQIRQATYTILPISTDNCEGDPDATTIVDITPAPGISTLGNIVCNGSEVNVTLDDTQSTGGFPAQSFRVLRPTLDPSTFTAVNYTAGTSAADNNTPSDLIKLDQVRNITDVHQPLVYSVEAYTGLGATGCKSTKDITVQIEPDIKVTPIVASNGVCSGGEVSIELSSPVTNPTPGVGGAAEKEITYSYRVTRVAGVFGATPGFNIPEIDPADDPQIIQSITNNTNNPQTIQYKILPFAAAAGGGVGCKGDTVRVDITIQPKPKMTASKTSITVCEDDALAVILNSVTTPSSSAGFGPLQFDLTNVIDPDNTPESPSAFISGFTNPAGAHFSPSAAPNLTDVLTTSAEVQRSIQYRFVPFFNVPGFVASTGTCSGDTTRILVTVSPRPVIDDLADFEVCSGEFFEKTLSVSNAEDASTLIKWTYQYNPAGDPDLKGASTGAGDLLSQVVFNNNSTQAEVTYKFKGTAFGCTGPESDVVVKVNPVPKISGLPTSMNVCNGGMLNIPLTNFTNVPGSSFVWTIEASPEVTGASGGSSASAINQVLSNVTESIGTVQYSIKPIGTGSTACEGTEVPVFVTVAPLVSGRVVSEDVAICKPANQFIELELKGQAPFTLVFNDGIADQNLTRVPNTFVKQYKPEVTTTYMLKSVKDAYGCTFNALDPANTFDNAVTITLYDQVKGGIEALVPEFVAGNATVTFTNTSTPLDDNVFDYEWDFDVASDVVSNPSSATTDDRTIDVDYSKPGIHEITLTITNKAADADGVECVTTINKIINIPVPPLVPAFTVTPRAACYPTTLEVVNTTPGADTFVWEIYNESGIYATSNLANPTFEISEPGVYDVVLTASLSLTGQEAAPLEVKGIEVYDRPVAIFDARPSTLFVPDTEVQTFNKSEGANFYDWNFDDGRVTSEFEPTHLYLLEGKYTITLVAGNDHGNKDIDGDGVLDGNVICYDTATRVINAREGGLTKIPNAFTPNPGGPSGGVAGSGTFNDVFLPITKGVVEFKMQIFDRWGTLVFESNDKNIGWDGYDRNGRLMPAGVYVYKLTLRLADDQRTTQVGDITLIR
jgi:gliding motility-associated-like protein